MSVWAERRGQEPRVNWPEGCCALLVPEPLIRAFSAACWRNCHFSCSEDLVEQRSTWLIYDNSGDSSQLSAEQGRADGLVSSVVGSKVRRMIQATSRFATTNRKSRRTSGRFASVGLHRSVNRFTPASGFNATAKSVLQSMTVEQAKEVPGKSATAAAVP